MAGLQKNEVFVLQVIQIYYREVTIYANAVVVVTFRNGQSQRVMKQGNIGKGGGSEGHVAEYQVQVAAYQIVLQHGVPALQYAYLYVGEHHGVVAHDIGYYVAEGQRLKAYADIAGICAASVCQFMVKDCLKI